MLDPFTLSAMAKLAQASLSEPAKEWAKTWLADQVRVKRAIGKTARAFSTRLPGTENALSVWVSTDAFRSALENLVAGALPQNVAAVDQFLSSTGLGFGSVSDGVVREMLCAFFTNIREDLISSRQGLVLVDNRIGEMVRQLNNLRSALPTGESVAVQRISTDLLNEVALRQGWGMGLQIGAQLHVNLDLPPAVRNIAERRKTVAAVHAILQNAAWYAMYGGSGSGKTQLAILVAREFTGMKVWIRLGDPESGAALTLETALTKLAARQPDKSVQEWCESACASLGSSAVIVLDNLPRTTGHGSIDENLTGLCFACAKTGVRLITTSSGPIPSGTRSSVGKNIQEEVVPGFSDEEIRELFQAYGAPDEFLTSTWFGFVHLTARRHPVILVEAARYLQARRWATDERSFDDLIQGTFASSLDLPTIARIKETIPNETTREFLYRLKVIGWTFGIEEMQRVSAVPPPISFPLEHLASVAGLWVNQEGNREYALSPLLSRLGDENLPKELQRSIHLTLAKGILEKRRIGPLQASQAIAHFVAGGNPDSAVIVLLVALQGMLRMSELSDPYALTAVWVDLPLPAEVALQKRIFLRAHQIILRQRLGKDTRYERADLERLMREGEENDQCQLVLAGAGAMLATYIGDQHPGLAIRSLHRGIKAARRLDMRTAGEEIGLRTGLLTLLWATAASIRSDAEYQEWFATVRELNPEELREWSAIPFAGQGSQAVCGGLWTRTADLSAAERDWAGVMERLEQLKSWARHANVRPLAAAAICNQIIVVAEYREDLQRADSIASEGLNEFNDLPKSKFSIADTIARQHYYFGDFRDAIRWFDVAFSVEEAARPAARVGSLTLAGIAAQSLDVELARRYLEDGIAITRDVNVGVQAGVRVKGELGILLWNAGQRREAFGVWSATARELFDARQDTIEWQTLFRIFGNCTGYFLADALGSRADEAAVTAPFPGILLREIKDIHELHKPELDWLLPVQMALLAENIGAYEQSMEWAAQARVGSGSYRVGAQLLLAGILASSDLVERRYLEIIRAAANLVDLDESFRSFGDLEDEVRAQRARQFSARLNLVALVLEVVSIGLYDRSYANGLAESSENLAREYSVGSNASRLWAGMTEVFGSLRGGAVSCRQLWEKATQAGKDGISALHAAYGIAAIPVASRREAVTIQLSIVPWLERMFSPTLYHVTVAKFIPEYWRSSLVQNPMEFGVLKITRGAIEHAEALDDKSRVRAILRAVAFSLAVRPPDDVQRWLDAG